LCFEFEHDNVIAKIKESELWFAVDNPDPGRRPVKTEEDTRDDIKFKTRERKRAKGRNKGVQHWNWHQGESWLLEIESYRLS